nr:etoposide induced protein 2.4 [Hymenolepis microstoma]
MPDVSVFTLLDVNVEALLLHIANYWPVFMGYGLPLGFLVTLSGNWYFTGDLLVSFLYPILVIGAFQISWSKVLDPKHRVSPCLRDLAVISMKPALFITNTIVSITASIGLGFMSP